MIDYAKRHTNRGFTILELLVVVAIIALLVALLVPSLRGALSATRSATCGSNLSKIGQALAIFAGDNPQEQEDKLSAERWPAQLLQYAGEGTVFVCPEGEATTWTSEQGAPDLTDLVSIHVTTTGYDLEFIESPWVAKLSDEQFQAADIRDGVYFHAPTYEPGADPTVYWYLLEDIPNQYNMIDYEIGVRVTENGDGTSTLRLLQVTGAGYNFNLIDKTDDRNILVRKSQMDGTAANEVVVGSGGGSSYGMNSAYNSISHSADKIIALDYITIVAHSSHDWDRNRFAGDVPGIPVFARHQGRMNVLFTGNSVHLKRPDEVNPTFHQTTLWDK